MARSGRLRRPGRGLGSDDQLKPQIGCGTTLKRRRFRLIVDGWATFRPGACAPLRRTFDDAVSPSTIRLKRASTIAEIRKVSGTGKLYGKTIPLNGTALLAMLQKGSANFVNGFCALREPKAISDLELLA